MWVLSKRHALLVVTISVLVIAQVCEVVLANCIDNQLENLTRSESNELTCCEPLISKTIPEDIGSYTNLSSITMDACSIDGSIPSGLFKLTMLMLLYLDQNQLTGRISSELGQLDSLEELYINENLFTGTVPSELGQLTKLVALYLSQNHLTGTIPSELGQLSDLRQLSWEKTRLAGTISSELGKASKLEILYLNQNDLTGTIPSELGQLGALGLLYINDNKLTGTIPSQLGKASEVYTMYLGFNRLNGSIPSELGKLSNLNTMYLGRNKLTGPVPSELLSISQLSWLDLRINQLNGTVPTEIGKSNMKRLFLDDNQLTGAIPNQLWGLTGLWDLDLHNNKFIGSISSDLGNLDALGYFELNNNQFTGAFPSEVGNLSELKELFLHSNDFTGIPWEDIALLGSAVRFTAHNNPRLDIESTFGSYNSDLRSLGSAHSFRSSDSWRVDISNESLSKALDQISALTNLRVLHLGSNFKGGTVPQSIDQFSSLVELDLRNNSLTGTLPTEMSLLMDIDVLNLHGNFIVDRDDDMIAGMMLSICSAGTFDPSDLDEMSGRPASERCKPCQAGTNQTYIGQLKCEPCPDRYYQPAVGSTECVKCENRAVDVTRTKCEDCSRNMEFNIVTGKCDNCAADTVSTPGFLCHACPPGTVYSDDDQTCIACPESNYMNDDKECKQCPPGTLCADPGNTIQTLVVLPGYWRAIDNSSDIYECPGGENMCIGTRLARNEKNVAAPMADSNLCANNHTGVFCASCIKNNVPRGKNATCSYCADDKRAVDISGAALHISIAVIAFSVALGLAAFCFVRFRRASLPSDENQPSSMFTTVLEYVNKVRPYVDVGQDLLSCKLRIILGFMQVFSAWTVLFVNKFPQPTVVDQSSNVSMFPESFGNSYQTMSFLTLDIWSSVDAGCALPRGHEARLISASIIPFALVLLILLGVGCSYIILTRSKSGHKDGNILYLKIRSAGLTNILVVLFLVYPSVSRVVFQTFDCEQVGKERVLRSDTALSCESDSYDWMLDLSMAMVGLFVVGVPMLQVGLLWFKTDVPFLTKHYLPQYHWFQLQELGTKLFQTTIVVVIFRNSRLLQSVYLLFVTVIALYSLSNMMPYRIYLDNVLAAVVQCALASLIGLGLVHSQDKDSRDSVAGLMLFTITVPFVVATGFSFLEIWQWRKGQTVVDTDGNDAALSWDEKIALKRIRTMLSEEATVGNVLKTKAVSRNLLGALGIASERHSYESVPVEVKSGGQELTESQVDVVGMESVNHPERSVSDEIGSVIVA